MDSNFSVDSRKYRLYAMSAVNKLTLIKKMLPYSPVGEKMTLGECRNTIRRGLILMNMSDCLALIEQAFLCLQCQHGNCFYAAKSDDIQSLDALMEILAHVLYLLCNEADGGGELSLMDDTMGLMYWARLSGDELHSELPFPSVSKVV